jgi:hypothetical protein
MFWRKKNRDEEMDRFGKTVVRATAISDTEAEAAASSPFLYARIRERITEEKRRQIETENSLFLLAFDIRHAFPALVAVAIFAIGLFWFSISTGSLLPRSGNRSDSQSGASANLFAPVTICSISNKEECAVSTNEVLTTIFSSRNQEIQR